MSFSGANFVVPAAGLRKLTGLTLTSAVLGCLAFPPQEMGGLAWVALVPLLLGLSQLRPLQGLLQGWLFGLVFMFHTAYFVKDLGAAPWVALAGGMSLFYAVFGLLAGALREAPPLLRVPALAAAWTLLELARGNAGPLAFTFGDLAYSQHTQTPLIQIASLCGHYGVTFLVALMNAGLATVLLAMMPGFWYRPGNPLLFNRLAGRVALACYVVLFLTYIWGSLLLRTGQGLEKQKLQTGVSYAVAAVQGSLAIPQRASSADVRRSGATYQALSRLPQPAQLIVWPETALPTILTYDRDAQQRVQEVLRQQRTHLLLGAVESHAGDIYNSAFLYGPDGSLVGTYRKQDLVIFGEYVPFRDQWKFLDRYPIRSKDFTPGQQRRVFPVHQLQLAPLICYEGIFPGPAREATALGATVLALITSDLWTVRSPEPEQHSQSAAFRAIESRRYVIRAATDGKTAIYDPYGEPISEVAFRQPGVAQTRIPAAALPRSVYHQVGDGPLLAICVFCLALGLLVKSRS